MSEVISLEIFK